MIPSFCCVGSCPLSHVFRIDLGGCCFKEYPPFFISVGSTVSESVAYKILVY